MVTPGSLGRYKPQAPSKELYGALVAAFLAYGGIAGYVAATQPQGAGWRLFSYHPMMMTFGMVTLFSISYVTKKKGGYLNTKLHGMIAMAGNFLALGGMYAIYKNKENMGKDHLTSTHGQLGASIMICCILLGTAGGVVLHPDFGIDKTNKDVRFAHKWFAKLVTIAAWINMFMGLQQVTDDTATLALVGVPLVVFFPLVIM